ncbi:hypothetical protein LAZ67_5001367 [Cordylochernes scorpioides]|uniref:PiggyBac transposable element-derived protein domain-containing protein n=1 Tax=Cordylochernes scorpioides TaxID=51811 RepID=A0ABY6KFI6_9ARAC|nr:hypothetical protein LAZ67_5001367 [Cordylochernes scorpioides]
MASDGDSSLSLSNVSDSSTEINSLESELDCSDSEDIPNANPWLPVYENQPERLLYRFTPATLSGTLPAPNAHPSEYFYLFMTPSLLQSIVDQTNIYASQYISANRSTAKPRSRFLNWTNTNLDEMKAFLGLILNMGLIKKRRIFEYWNKRNWSQDTPAFFRIPRDRFWLILKFLHLNNNQNDTKVDPLFKVSPVLESLNKSFLKYFIPDRNLSIDESLVKQKNRTRKRQYIPKSHAKFGIKHWVLCEAQSGYTLQFDIYAGKAASTPSSSKGLAFDVVFRLVNNANLLDKGYHIICDNFYTSVDLALDLYARRTYLTGTMRLNRRSLPSSIRSKKLQPSEKLYRFRDPVLLLRWREKRSQKKPVILLSTKMHASSDEVTTASGRSVTMPAMVQEYNKGMGGIAQMVEESIFSMVFRAMINSYIIYKKNCPNPIDRLHFHIEIVEALIGDYDGRKLEPSTSSLPRAPTPKHSMERLPERKEQNCIVCSPQLKRRKRTRYHCIVCKKGVCPGECWEQHLNT